MLVAAATLYALDAPIHQYNQLLQLTNKMNIATTIQSRINSKRFFALSLVMFEYVLALHSDELSIKNQTI